MKKLILLLLVVCMTFVGCKKPTTGGQSGSDSSTSEQQQPGGGSGYVPADSVLSFSDENADKVITEATFDVSQYTSSAGGNINPYKIFADGMCLQRDAINRIWGYCSNNEHIAVEINGKVYYGTVSSGKFEVYLPMMREGGPYSLTFISEAGRKTLNDVYIGEVFLLSGQSNMEFYTYQGGDVLKDLYSSQDCINDEIRMLQVGWSTPTVPTTDALNYSTWKGAANASIRDFSAVGYLFGKQMQEELDCPVGLISNPVGGSSIEFWLSQENYNEVQKSYKSYTTSETYMTPNLGYNGMLYPLTGINVRGVVWYQGESNAFGTQEYYDIALKIFIEQCREMFDNENLAFTICQLARYEGNPYAYSVVNERINYVASSDPYIAVARNLDQGEWDDIHPKDKRTIGARAAYETLRRFFKKNKAEPIKVTGYTFNDDGSVTVDLSADATLVNGTNGFEVSVNNGQYTYNCDVSIQGNKLTVSANGNITKVRYGYTCKMNAEIQKDVSKMVTVYDANGFPLDLFEIAKDPSMPNAPSVTPGYCDSGYEITVDGEGAFVVGKSANASLWTCAWLSVSDYSSDYTSFTIKCTTDNVTNLTLQFYISGVEAGWQQYINLRTTTVADGEHEIVIDFSEILAIDSSWNAVSGHYVKDYNIDAILISLDTAVDSSSLINEDATCTIHEIVFNAEQ